MYMFRITWIRLAGTLSFSAMSSQSVYRSTLSYALFKSKNINPNGCFACKLYCTSCYTISACSIVVYFFLKPAYVGAYN
jgi:hypothetical protein